MVPFKISTIWNSLSRQLCLTSWDNIWGNLLVSDKGFYVVSKKIAFFLFIFLFETQKGFVNWKCAVALFTVLLAIANK